MLQILSPDFSAIDNDDIFLAANDHNPTFGEIANVLGVKPSVQRQDLTSFLGIVEVPGHHVCAAQKNYAGMAIRQNPALFVTNFDLNSRQRDAANYKRPCIRYFRFGVWVTSIQGQSHPTLGQRSRVNSIDGDALVDGCETYGESGLCHSVAGHKCTRLKSAWLQNFGKLRQGS